MSEVTALTAKQARALYGRYGERGAVRTVPWLNLVQLLAHGPMRAIRSARMMARAHTIAGDNRAIFRKLFGPVHFRFDGEYNYYVYALEFEGEHFLAFTHPEKGTSYEWVQQEGRGAPDAALAKRADRFIQAMERQILAADATRREEAAQLRRIRLPSIFKRRP